MYTHVCMYRCTRHVPINMYKKVNERKQVTYMHVTITEPHDHLIDTYKEGRQQSSLPLTSTPLNGLNRLHIVCLLPQVDSSKTVNGSIEYTPSSHAFNEKATLKHIQEDNSHSTHTGQLL